jgi:predicted branched-subunit amino acid permease
LLDFQLTALFVALAGKTVAINAPLLPTAHLALAAFSLTDVTGTHNAAEAGTAIGCIIRKTNVKAKIVDSTFFINLLLLKMLLYFSASIKQICSRRV